MRLPALGKQGICHSERRQPVWCMFSLEDNGTANTCRGVHHDGNGAPLLQNHSAEFQDKLVLVTGYSRTDLKEVLRSELGLP